MLKVSIIIPVYNAEKYLKRCLDSAINQTLKDIEIICINDCSTDNSLKILNEYSRKDSRIKVLTHDKNKGEGATRNTALEIAQGEYIAFLDSDDALSLDFCEKLYNKTIGKSPDFVLSNALRKQEKNENIVNENEIVYQKNNILFFTSYFCSAIYKKAILDKYNIKYTPNLPLSTDLLFVNEFLLHAKTFEYEPNVFYIYFRRADSMNGQILSDEKLDSGLFVFNKMIDNFNSNSEILKNREGYEYYCSYMFFNYFNVIFKNNNSEKRMQSAKLLIDGYKKIKYKDLLLKKLKGTYPLFEQYLAADEQEKIVELFQLNKNEFMTKNLRYKIGKNRMKNIPIFITSDNNYAPYVSTLMASILSNTKSFINFYIMDSGITDENQEKIKELKNTFNNFSIEFIKIDEDKYYKGLDCKDYSNRIPLATYNSALIPVVKPDLEKVLYLDPDIVVMGDIKEMYDFDIKDYIIGALWEEFCEDNVNRDRKSYLKLNSNHKYFNAGVFIINSQKWLENNITQKVFDTWQKYEDVLINANQDVLNIVFDNTNYMPFPNKFNWLNHNYDFWGKPKENIIVRHFNGMVKPWEISPDLEEDELIAFTRDFKKFWEIARLSPFYKELVENVKYNNLTKFRVYKLMVNHAKKQGV